MDKLHQWESGNQSCGLNFNYYIQSAIVWGIVLRNVLFSILNTLLFDDSPTFYKNLTLPWQNNDKKNKTFNFSFNFLLFFLLFLKKKLSNFLGPSLFLLL